MPDIRGSMAHYDLDDPEDFAFLIERGLIWRSGPRTVTRAVQAIVRGDVPRPTNKVPPKLDAYFDKMGVARPASTEVEPAPAAEPSPLDPEEG